MPRFEEHSLNIDPSTVQNISTPQKNNNNSFNPDERVKEIDDKKHGITVNFFDFLKQLSHPHILWFVLVLYIVVLYPLSEMVDTTSFLSLNFYIQWASLIIDSMKPVIVFVAGIIINDYMNLKNNNK